MKKEFELSQSAMKDWSNFEDKKQWHEKWVLGIRPYEYNRSFIYGSLLDGFLFDKETLKKRFATYRGKDKPSDNIQAIVGLSVLKAKKMPFKQALIEASKELDYGQSWKEETLLKRFDNIDDYIEFCKQNSYKTVVMYDYAKDIQKVAEYLINHEPNSIRQYILEEPSEDYHNMFQVTLKGNLLGIPCKIIIDILHFDEINNTVRVIDFKTTYDADRFKESIVKYGYDKQVSFYDEIVKLNPEIFKNYTLLSPLNVVVGKRDLGIYIHNYFEHELEESKREWIQIVKEIKEYLKSLNNDKK